MAIFGAISLWSFGTFESRAELLFLGASGGGGPAREQDHQLELLSISILTESIGIFDSGGVSWKSS